MATPTPDNIALANLTPLQTAIESSGGRWKPYRHLKYLSWPVSNAIWQGNARIVINMPFRHGKTEFISHRTPVWALRNWPWMRLIAASNVSDLATENGRNVRNTIRDNPWLGVELREDSKAAGRWNTPQGGGLVATGVGGSMGWGAHLAIVDDPHKKISEVRSPAYQKELIDWFNSVLYTRLEPNGSIIVLHSRFPGPDLAGYLLGEYEFEGKKCEEEWTHISLPALAEENDPMGRRVGEPLCPERYDLEALTRIKNVMFDPHWQAMYQQKQVAREDMTWKEHWWQWYDTPPKVEWKMQSWDTAFKVGDRNSYTVCSDWRVAKNGYYLTEIWRQRVEYPELKRALVARADKLNPRTILVEDKASGQSVVQELRRETRLPLIPINAGDADKDLREELVAPTIEAGKVFLPKRAPWLSDFLDEVRGTAYRDQRDSVSQALQYLSQSEGAEYRIWRP